MNITFKQLLVAGGPILFILAGLSIYSIALIWERWSAYGAVFKGMDDLLRRVQALIKSGETRQIAELCSRNKSPAADIIHKVLIHYGNPLEKRELAEKAIEWHASRLNKRLTAIATIASISPFIGLFGTVIGVIRAFRDLSMYAGAGPSVVAMGIAEALVNTAAGLFVAVPAIIAYNYFVHRSNDFSTEMNWMTEQLIDKTAAREFTGVI
ncbi:MAG TPA: MotA/TolQ/ExbB proton channel family protein [Elusimicrobiales bacterium]|nr:MotA/TolQ/ExbB proton channel family protein [Elusimicrobiales bacterium]